jgi:chromatin structure-remodeling complex subunit RSC1/2
VYTVKYFDRDGQTNELLWFSAPPMNVSRDPGPRHSLAYLHFLARKRKEGGELDQDTVAKRPRVEVLPTFMETTMQIFAETFLDT